MATVISTIHEPNVFNCMKNIVDKSIAPGTLFYTKNNRVLILMYVYDCIRSSLHDEGWFLSELGRGEIEFSEQNHYFPVTLVPSNTQITIVQE